MNHQEPLSATQFQAREVIRQRFTQEVETRPTDEVGTKPGLSGDQVPPEVLRMLTAITGEMSRGEIMAKPGLKDEKHFREHYQQAGISCGVIEMTISAKPQSSRQRYRLTEHGKALRDEVKE